MPRSGDPKIVGSLDRVGDVTAPGSAAFGEGQGASGESPPFLAVGQGVFDEVFNAVVVVVAIGSAGDGW